MGKPYPRPAPFDVEFCISSFEFYGGLADKVPGHAFDLGPVAAHTVHEPYGVVGGIIPFNWPPIHTAAKSAPALAAGNVVVLKPPEQDPLTIMRIVELLEEVLPPDVLQVVPGRGPEAGTALAGHPLVERLSFTGSTATGRAVLKLAADAMTPATLRARREEPVDRLRRRRPRRRRPGRGGGGVLQPGRGLHRRLRGCWSKRPSTTSSSPGWRRRAPAAGRRRARPRHPRGTADQRGAAAARPRLHRQGVAEGATVAAQPPLPADAAPVGRLLGRAPTLFTDVTPSMAIARDEVFGPVTAVLRSPAKPRRWPWPTIPPTASSRPCTPPTTPGPAVWPAASTPGS